MRFISSYRSGVREAAGGGGGGDYYVDFTALGVNENPISLGGVWTTPSLNNPMQIRLSADSTTRICCDTVATADYDDSVSIVQVPFAGNQRIEATLYKQADYAPVGDTSNHEMELFVGVSFLGGGGKRGIEVAFNFAGGYFVAGFNGDLTSWQAPGPEGYMSSPWYSAATGLGGTPTDGDVFRVELNRTAKTLKAWQNTTLIIDLQWNDLTHVTAEAQAVLNALGSYAGLAGLRRLGPNAVLGAFGWRNVRISSTLLG